MLWGGNLGGLEVRRSGGDMVRLRGSFPYGKRAVLSDGGRNGGRPKKEVFAPRAFAYNVEREDIDIMFLSGHRYDKPLASRKAGTLSFEDTDEALHMEATLTPEIQETSWARDFLSAHNAGLVSGLSPGFRIPPQITVPDAEMIEEEDPSEGRAIIRTINHALLWEMSAVTKPAYDEAQIQARNWKEAEPVSASRSLAPVFGRWRL